MFFRILETEIFMVILRRLPSFAEDFSCFAEDSKTPWHSGITLFNMAARFPASASMQKMANNPQQASMFQRSQFQQAPYGMAVSSWLFDCFVLPLNPVKPRP